MAGDLIDRKAAIDAIQEEIDLFLVIKPNSRKIVGPGVRCEDVIKILRRLPSAEPEDWMERNKERILQAGMEGREIEFRIGGRLFAIREKAQ